MVFDHDLARKAQTDAGAVGFGGVEWDEDFVDLPQRDGLAVVGHTDDGLVIGVQVGGDADGVGTCLDCVFNQVVEHQHHLAFIGKDKQINGFGGVGQSNTLLGGLGFVEAHHPLHQLIDHHGLADGWRHRGDTAV